MKFSIEKEQKIVELYKQGYNTVEIGKFFNTYNTSIRRVLIRNHIKLISYSERMSYLELNEKFLNPNNLTKEEEYFLGLLITDGCISGTAITLALKEQDIYILKKFAAFLGKKVKVNKYFHTKHNKYQYYVKVRSNILCERLQKLANFKNKSFDLELFIPLTFNILRGILDGDGWIDKRSYIGFCGKSNKFLNQILEFLASFEIVSKIIIGKTCNYIHIRKQKDVLFLYENLYNSTELFLERKKNNLGPLLKKFNK